MGNESIYPLTHLPITPLPSIYALFTEISTPQMLPLDCQIYGGSSAHPKGNGSWLGFALRLDCQIQTNRAVYGLLKIIRGVDS
jgi:hypothetical protein